MGLQVTVGPLGNSKRSYVVSTGSMNYVYIWERMEKENTYFDDMDVQVLHSNTPMQDSFVGQMPQSFGWNQYPIMGHDDFTQLNSSVLVIGSEEDDDNIQVNYSSYQMPNQFSVMQPATSFPTTLDVEMGEEEDEDIVIYKP